MGCWVQKNDHLYVLNLIRVISICFPFIECILDRKLVPSRIVAKIGVHCFFQRDSGKTDYGIAYFAF